jgi:hypothetical protein
VALGTDHGSFGVPRRNVTIDAVLVVGAVGGE